MYVKLHAVANARLRCMTHKVYTWTKGGATIFFNELRKPEFKLKILGHDTMLSFMH